MGVEAVFCGLVMKILNFSPRPQDHGLCGRRFLRKWPWCIWFNDIWSKQILFTPVNNMHSGYKIINPCKRVCKNERFVFIKSWKLSCIGVFYRNCRFDTILYGLNDLVLFHVSNLKQSISAKLPEITCLNRWLRLLSMFFFIFDLKVVS